jgi:uncharacterized membrane protein
VIELAIYDCPGMNRAGTIWMRSERIQDREGYSPYPMLLLLVIVAIGFYFRFANLDRKVYWNDEVWVSVRLSGHTGSQVIRQIFDGREIGVNDLQRYQHVNPESRMADTIIALAVEDAAQPPFYYFIARLWVKVFGDSIKAIRSLSAVISLLSLPCLYWLCRELFDLSLVGWIAVALMAVSPFHILYAQEAYQYSLWTVIIIVSNAALLRGLQVQRRWVWSIYAASIAVGLYTHTLFSLVVIAHGVYIAGVYLRKSNLNELRLPKSVTCYVLAVLAGLIGYAPWAVVIIVMRSDLHPSWLNKKLSLLELIRQWSYNFSSVFFDTGGYVYGIGGPLINLVSLSILSLAAYSLYVLCRTAPKRTWFFVVTLAGSVFVPLMLLDLVWGGQRSAIARYLIPAYLGIQLAFAHLVATRMVSPSFLQRTIWQGLLVILIGAGIISCAISSQAEAWWNKAASRNIPEVARIINRYSRPLVISDSSGLNPWNLISLSYRLEPKVRFRLAMDPDVPAMSNGFSEVLLFNPDESLRRQLEMDERFRVEPVSRDGMLWQLVRE